MPLSIQLLAIAVVAALLWWARSGRRASGGRFVAMTAAMWLGLFVAAIAIWFVATLIFGR